MRRPLRNKASFLFFRVRPWRTVVFWFLFLPGLSRGEEVVVLQTTDIHMNTSKEGFPSLAGLIDTVRATQKNVLLIDCGDTIQGTYEATLDKGVTAAAVMKEMRYDVFVPGNHDFEFGEEPLATFVESFGGLCLAANLRSKAFPKLFKDWAIFDKSGIRICVIGLTTPFQDRWLRPALRNLYEETCVRVTLDRIMPDILAEKPDLILLAGHFGEHTRLYDAEPGGVRGIRALVWRYPQIHVILGGHSHQEQTGKKLGRRTWFIQSPAHGAGVAWIRIQYDLKKRRIQSLESKFLRADDTMKVPRRVLAVTEALNAQAKEQGELSAGSVAEMTGGSKKTPGRDFLVRELGRAIQKAGNAKAAFACAESNYQIRPGTVTERALYRLFPYENTVATLALTASEVKMILNEQRSVAKEAESTLVLTGARVEEKDGQLRGPLICESTGEPWREPGQRFRVAFPSYVLTGANGRYPLLRRFAEKEECAYHDTGIRIRDAFRDRLK